MRTFRRTLFMVALSIGLLACAPSTPDGSGSPTFARDVAPIVFEHCSGCHHPDGAAPISLVDYADLRKHAHDIGEVTRSGFMPPWPPDDGEFALLGRRGLSDDQLRLISRWVETGAPLGDPTELPPAPSFETGWSLGEPDLVVTMETAFTLPAEGLDVFRNFVIPVPVEGPRWVKAVELLPGKPSVVHHAILQIDATPTSRHLDEQDAELGFGGMEMGGSRAPDGHFIGWTPGRTPFPTAEGMAWRLDRGTDLVLQLHMLPSGKPETIRPQVGFHFTDRRPTRRPSAFSLFRNDIDIPAGAADYRIEDELTLPVDVRLLGLYPHAHYLGKELGAYARFPDGSEKTLLRIPDWDFNWQTEYRFAEAVALPAGTVLSMRYGYDNSSDNVRNPSFPPRRVTYGNRSVDEMGTLTVQLVAGDERQRALLNEAVSRRIVEKDTDDWSGMLSLASALIELGRPAEARPHLQRVVRLRPDQAEARLQLGVVAGMQRRADAAERHYRSALRLNPDLARAWNNLGKLLLDQGEPVAAIEALERAVALRPGLDGAYYNLGVALTGLERYDDAVEQYERSLALNPDPLTYSNLGVAHHLRGDLDEAIRCYGLALEGDTMLIEAHNNLGRALQTRGDLDRAIEHFRAALAIDAGFDTARDNLNAALAGRKRRESP